MRHRIIGNVKVLGRNSDPEIMANDLTGNETFDAACRSIFDRVCEEYFADYKGFDYSAKLTPRGFELLLGIEPAYKYEPLRILTFKKAKTSCSIRIGHARGYYGSAITSHTTKYADADEKFRSLVDAIHPVLIAGYEAALAEKGE